MASDQQQRSTRPDAIQVGSRVRIVGASGRGWRGYGGFVEKIESHEGEDSEVWVRIPFLYDNGHAWVLLRDLEPLEEGSILVKDGAPR